MNVQSTRRSFLAATSTGLAAWTIVRPRTAFGTAANEKIKVGVVGLGGRGSMIAGMLNEHGGYQITGLADYFPDPAKRAAARLGVPEAKVFSGLSAYRRLLDSGVEAVVLKTPPYFFPQHAAAAVDAGCHVYVAKPVAVDVPGCLTIRELGAKSTRDRKVFHVDFQWRYLTYLVKCMEHIRAGKMGDIRFVRAFYNDEGRVDRPVRENIAELFQGLRWTMSRELGGDRIVSAGIHAIDTALIVIGSHPTSACGVVQRSRKNPVNSATDTASLTYSFGDKVTMNYSGDQFRNYHGDIDMFSGVKAYADGAHMQTFYGKGITCMRNANWRYKGGENTDLYKWGARHNISLFHRCVTGGDCGNATVPGAVDANLTCLLGAYAGRARDEMTWEQLLANKERMTIDTKGLVD